LSFLVYRFLFQSSAFTDEMGRDKNRNARDCAAAAARQGSRTGREDDERTAPRRNARDLQATIVELQRQIDAELSIAAAVLEHAAAAIERTAAAKELIAATNERLAEAHKRANGTYYTPIDDLWPAGTQVLTENYFDRFRRTKFPSFLDWASHDSYTTSTEQAFLADTVMVDDDETTPSSSSGASTVWPSTTFNVDDIASDMAHLVPANATNAGMYADVARCVFAVPDRPGNEAADGPVLQKLIHGCGSPGGERTPDTGMKHMFSNKVRLPLQGTYFDRSPCFFIIPCLPLAAVKAWNGGSYSAIVVAGSWDGIEACNVYRDVMPRRALSLASVDQVNIARELLTDTVLALAYSFHHRRERMTDGANPETITALHHLADIYKPAGPNGEGIIVPVKLQHDLPDMRIGLIKYVAHDGEPGHPAPDPMLLVIKAAINWSWRNNQKMMAEGEPEEAEDELDILEEERYLAFHQDSCRPQSSEKLAAGLHQPNGWVDHATDAD
jgi:hypothetical protein